MKKTILMGLIVGVLATVAMASTGAMSTVYADKGGDPNNSDQSQENANERHTKKVLKAIDAITDDNPHNDRGPLQAHANTHDGNGVDCC